MTVTSARKLISPYYVSFVESFSSALVYTSQPYVEVMAMRPAVSYIPCATSSRGQTGNIITVINFEQENLSS